MTAQSKAQQRFMGMVHAAQKGDLENPSKEVEKAADSMTDKAAKDFASTKHKGLPNHVKKENKIDLEDEDLPSAVLPVSAENTMKGYDASCGCFRTESADVNQNAVMASIEDLPNNRTQKNFPLPTNRVLWNATGKVCEGRPVVERIKMYEKKGGGWREGVKGDEQVFNSLKELYYERKQVEEIKESVRAILKKKVQTESKLNEDLTDEIAALPNHHTAEDTAEATLVVGKYAVVRYDESDEGGEDMYVVWDNTVNQDEIGSYDDEPEFESTDPAEVAAFLMKNS
jgi:hypothetical protein